MNAVRHFEMGYSEQEFAKVLTGAFTGQSSLYAHSELAERRWRINKKQGDFSIEIEIKQSSPRRLGLMEIPVLDVQFFCDTDADSEFSAFMEKFFKYFHKGGG